MMAYTTAFEPAVVRSYPRNLATLIPNNAVIKIDFNTDLDRDYITMHVLVSDASGTLVDGELSYNERTISFAPKQRFGAGQTIRIKIIGDDLSGNNVGIRSVLGTRMKGNYDFSFTVTGDPAPRAVQGITPVNQSIQSKAPTFTWKPVEKADYYQIEISQSNLLNPVIWPAAHEDYRIEDISTPLSPNYNFVDGLYYWRVRAVHKTAGKGEWSPVYSFNIDTQTEGVVSEEDPGEYEGIYHDSFDFDDSVEILEIFPEENFSNVALNLKTIYVRVMGTYTLEDVQNSFTVIGERADGDETDPLAIHGEIMGVIDVTHDNGTTIISFTLPDILEVTV